MSLEHREKVKLDFRLVLPCTSEGFVSASSYLLLIDLQSCSYEGTGRSLSLKLIQQLRQQSAQAQASMTAENKSTATAKLTAGTAPH